MSAIDTMLATDIQNLEVSQSKSILTMTLTALRINLSAKTTSSHSVNKTTNTSSSLPNDLVKQLPEISLKEVAFHDCIDDCWIVLYDRVYNITKFLDMHPGGGDIILEYGGRDATIAFRGTGHSKMALKQIQDYLIGELPPHERIYRNSIESSGLIIKLSNIPD